LEVRQEGRMKIKDAYNLLKLFKFTKMKQFGEKLKSRKLIVVILTSVLTTIGSAFGLPADAIQWLVQLAAAFIVGQGFADFGAQGKAPRDYFDKKFILVIISGVVVAVANYIDLPADLMKWLTHLMSGFLVAQGVADAGKKGEVEGDLAQMRLDAIAQEEVIEGAVKETAAEVVKPLKEELEEAQKKAEEVIRNEIKK